MYGVVYRDRTWQTALCQDKAGISGAVSSHQACVWPCGLRALRFSAQGCASWRIFRPRILSRQLRLLPLPPAPLLLLPLLAYTRVTIAYFYATEKTALSYVLVFSEPVLTFVVLLILPHLLKLTGVWLAIPAAQALTFCIAVPARRRTQRARELPA